MSNCVLSSHTCTYLYLCIANSVLCYYNHIDRKRVFSIIQHFIFLLQISICDDYSLPIDFVKKRPSSFDPCLADRLPDNWGTIATSPLSEQVSIGI